jgi:hypothetical protein
MARWSLGFLSFFFFSLAFLYLYISSHLSILPSQAFPPTKKRQKNHDFSKATLPLPPTLANVIFVGDADEDEAGDDVFVGSDNRASEGEIVKAEGTAPAGASAISLTSRVVRLSERALPERDWMRIVTGPRKWRKS